MSFLRRLLIAFACVAVLSCGTIRRTHSHSSLTLAAAVRFGKAHHQEAVYILSTGEEIRLGE